MFAESAKGLETKWGFAHLLQISAVGLLPSAVRFPGAAQQVPCMEKRLL